VAETDRPTDVGFACSADARIRCFIVGGRQAPSTWGRLEAPNLHLTGAFIRAAAGIVEGEEGDTQMWLWIAVGFAVYAALMLLFLSMARAATAADRSERRVFRAWLDEGRGRVTDHPVLRDRRPPKVA
jgi:hypothetical protein